MKIFTLLAALWAGTALAATTRPRTVTVTTTAVRRAPTETVTRTEVRKGPTVTETVTRAPATRTVTVSTTRTFRTLATVTETDTATQTSTAVETSTNTVSETQTVSQTQTISQTQTVSETQTQTQTISQTVTASSTVTNTVSTTSTETDTTTVTATTTTTTSPTSTPFIGTGNLIVFSSGSKNGHVSKYGGWYTSSSPATYNGAAMSADGSTFTLTTSQGPCQVLGSGAFNCTAANTNSVFGQTADGNLTFSGSDIFGAANGPTTNAPGSVISDAAGQFTLNIQWVSTM